MVVLKRGTGFKSLGNQKKEPEKGLISTSARVTQVSKIQTNERGVGSMGNPLSALSPGLAAGKASKPPNLVARWPGMS